MNNKNPPKKILKSKQPQAQPQQSAELNEIMRRLRILEERYANLRKKSQLTDQNMLDDSKRIFDDIHVIQSIIAELKRDIEEIRTKMRLLTEEIEESVQKRELNLLSKYLDFWQPMEFVRKGEVKTIIEDVLEDIKPKSI